MLSRCLQMGEVKQISTEVKQQARLAEFMSMHAERFGGSAGGGQLLWKELAVIRAEEERGRYGMANKGSRGLGKGILREWIKLVAGQAGKAQVSYEEVDKATKRLDQRAIIQIISKRPRFLTTSWLRTHKAALLALGATSKIGDPQATDISSKMLRSNEHALREGACKLCGMILDPKNREVLQLVHKLTSRREHPDVRAAAKKAVQDIAWRAKK